jgi:hypothetical protein
VEKVPDAGHEKQRAASVTDFDWVDVSGSEPTSPSILGNPLGATFDFSTKMKWIGTARARAGYANDDWLYYVTFGAAPAPDESMERCVGVYASAP